MDIYRFTKSKSKNEFIKGWSRMRGFSPLEMAFIIFESENLLSEKHEAYRELFFAYPNMELEASTRNKDSKNLHHCLSALLAREEYLFERFPMDDANMAYQADVYGYSWGGRDFQSAEYKSFVQLKNDLGTLWERKKVDCDYFCFIVKKHITDSGEVISAKFNYDWELLAISDYPIIEQEHYDKTNDPAGFLYDYRWKGIYDKLQRYDDDDEIIYVGRSRNWNIMTR